MAKGQQPTAVFTWGWDAAKKGIGRGEKVKVTEAEVILVAVDGEGRPIPVRPETVKA